MVNIFYSVEHWKQSLIDHEKYFKVSDVSW